MKRQHALLFLLGGSVLAYLYTKYSQQNPNETVAGNLEDSISNVTTSIAAAVVGWKNVGQASTWIPFLNEAEDAYGLPPDLLARMAYEESRFREEIIRGTKASSVGALGIMQLMPQFYQSVNVPRPYSNDAVLAQIDVAAKTMVSNFHSTQSWPLALAAYNAGLGNVNKYNGIPPFKETQDYVSQIVADVPALA